MIGFRAARAGVARLAALVAASVRAHSHVTLEKGVNEDPFNPALRKSWKRHSSNHWRGKHGPNTPRRVTNMEEMKEQSRMEFEYSLGGRRTLRPWKAADRLTVKHPENGQKYPVRAVLLANARKYAEQHGISVVWK